MTRFYTMTLLGFTTVCLLACGAPAAPQTAREPPPEAPRAVLNHLVEHYWDESAAANLWYSWGGAEGRFGAAPADAIAPQALADSLALERRYLADLPSVSRTGLDADAQLTYDMFRRERELTIESYTYPAELLPVNAYDSMPQRFALMAAAAERHALVSTRDFDTWQARTRGYERWTSQAIINLREGMRRGYTLPLAVVERTLPVLAALSEDAPTSVFYEPLRDTGTADDAERSRLRLAITTVVKDRILPSYRTLHDFLQREYLPRARVSIGLSALPLGDAWYGYLVRRATDGTHTPAELHALGLAEVERAHTRIQALLADTAFAGNPPGFVDHMRHDPGFSYKTADELSSAYQELKTALTAAVPTLFAGAPQADFDLRSVETFRTATAPALSYRRSLASGRNPAVLYVNTADLDARPAIAVAARFLREAVPGHHYQLSLQQERADLPRFRRFGGAPAFIHGWGLYAASLGDELGVYHDPEARFGALLAQLECAAGMVIDTGIHAQKWSRGQALDYLHAQMPWDDVANANAVDRDLAMPGDALACMVGFLKIQELRAHAQQTLGGRFDVHAFHTELLRNGAVPLDLLGADIERWVAAAEKMD